MGYCHPELKFGIGLTNLHSLASVLGTLTAANNNSVLNRNMAISLILFS